MRPLRVVKNEAPRSSNITQNPDTDDSPPSHGLAKALAITSVVVLGLALIILAIAYFKGVARSTQVRFPDRHHDVVDILKGWR